MASPSPSDLAQNAAETMRDRIRAHDWGATPLGPMDQWPLPLRFAVDLCEHSSLPTVVYWGPDLRLIYNDAWEPFADDRHIWALGRPAEEVWSEIWHIVGSQLKQVWDSARGLATTETMLPIMRGGVLHETYWNYSLIPLFNERGSVAGILGQATEVTKAVVAEQRLSFQISLADSLRECNGPREVKATASRMLGEYLRAARVGYAEINSVEGSISYPDGWCRDDTIADLAGATLQLEEFGRDSNEWLASGKLLVSEDVKVLAATDPIQAAVLEGLGIRALIVVPLVRDGIFRAILYVHDTVPRSWKRSEIAIARDVAERTWDAVQRAQVEKSLRDSEDHYRHVVELNPSASWTALPEGPINRMSPRWMEWTGTSGLGEGWLEAFHPDDVARTIAARAEALQHASAFDVEHRLRQRNGSYRWYRSRCFPRLGRDGKPVLWYGTTEDIDSQHRAEEHQRLLINELNHRVKNTLATVQAIAFQTLKGDISLSEARARFEARLLALSRAHNLLTEENWEGAPIWRVVADSIAHLSSEKGRFILSGEPMWLAPRAALALALACHELSTNAVKYGALSDEKGHVEVRWHKDDAHLCIEWKEKGGPPVTAPSGRGFGSRLIERGVAGDLDGKAKLDFEPDGLRCTIEAPLSAVLPRESQEKAK